jgi:protocatechuate 3,4-dioxygenase, beta subunit
MNDLSRRNLVKTAVGALSMGIAGKAVASTCGFTPAQTEGPFYPLQKPKDQDWDLTQMKGKFLNAKGEVVYVKGKVVDQSCYPVSGALVEIWQANKWGRYSHPSDPNTAAPLDPNFQGFGWNLTNKDGEYFFRTIIPGQYPATSNWIRPAHIHFKVSKRGYKELTTQLYFKGDPYNDRDAILMSMSLDERSKVISDFKPEDNSGDYPVGYFEIAIKKVAD